MDIQITYTDGNIKFFSDVKDTSFYRDDGAFERSIDSVIEIITEKEGSFCRTFIPIYSIHQISYSNHLLGAQE